jgi:hypothetical protein
MTFADKVIQFNKELSFTDILPRGIQVLNPFKDNPEIISISELFYNKFYRDKRERKLILGINPGRLGAGATGIPFTDSKRLLEVCGIQIDSVNTHEPSSVFVYDVIKKYGGPKKFYGTFYINSICPLGFIIRNQNKRWINCNYHDYEELFCAMEKFISINLKKQISFGIDTSVCYVLGKRNAQFLKIINDKENLFQTIIALDHPRYIQQYKSKLKDKYISEYLYKFES